MNAPKRTVFFRKLKPSKTNKVQKFESKSLKKARSTLNQTKKQLDSVMASELANFENKKLEVIGEMSSKMAHDIRNPLLFYNLKLI